MHGSPRPRLCIWNGKRGGGHVCVCVREREGGRTSSCRGWLAFRGSGLWWTWGCGSVTLIKRMWGWMVLTLKERKQNCGWSRERERQKESERTILSHANSRAKPSIRKVLDISSAHSSQTCLTILWQLKPIAAEGVRAECAAKMAAAAPCQQATCRHLLLRQSDIVLNRAANNCCYSRRLTRRGREMEGEGGRERQRERERAATLERLIRFVFNL